MNIFLQGIYSFFCVFGFSIMFNIPRKHVLLASLNGAIGWIVYALLQNSAASFIVPPLVGSIVVGIIGEISAIKNKQPATLFIIPGIIPFVPGYGIYTTMFHVINDDFSLAIVSGTESIFVAVSIACGVVIATSLVRQIKITFPA
jgi:uncharacterized membrane protein YjjB (DUF3815 family)